MQLSAEKIAELISGKVVGNAAVLLDGPCKIDDGHVGKITFLSNPKYTPYIYTTQASVVIVDKGFVAEQPVSTTLIVVDNVYLALSTLMSLFDAGLSILPEISPDAIVDKSAIIGSNPNIASHVIVKQGVKIGANSKIHSRVYIGDNVTIGDNVILYPGVVIYHNCVIGSNVTIHANTVVGSDGFGFASDQHGKYTKIAQIGNVVIEDDVEIGANTVIDRATMGSTIISKGVKLDNLIQIAHNVFIGENTVIAAQTGIAGSTKIGSRCIVGGQVGIVGHIEIADGTMFQAQSGVASSIKEPNGKFYGTPAIDYQNYLRSYAQFRKLNDLAKQVAALQKEVDQFKNNL
jgi:UDP-3-O-[3-hydroxymyristoyl] glucosamine N-acyltransferase